MTIAAIALRFAAISARGGYLGWDETMFLQMGRNFILGRGYQLNGLPNVTFPALPAVMAAGLWMATGAPSPALHLMAALFGGAAVVPVYLLGRRMFSRGGGLAAAIVFAGFRPLLLFTPFCSYRARFYSGSEPVFLFLTAWTLYFFYRAWQERSILWAALAGLVCGISFLARQEALILSGALAFWLVAAALIRRRSRGRLAAGAALSLVLFVVGAAPWFAYGKSVTGHFLLGPHLSHNMRVREAFWAVYHHDDWRPFFRIHHAINEDNTEFESPYYGVAPYHLEKYEAYSNTDTFSRLFRGLRASSMGMWLRDMLFLVPFYVMPFVLLGLPVRPWRRALANGLFLICTLSPAVAIALTLLVLPRYNVYTSALLAVYAGGGLSTAGAWIGRKLALRRGAITIATAAAIAAAGAVQALHFNYASRETDHWERHIERLMPLAAGKLEQAAPGPTRVVAHGPQAPFAAGDIWIPLPTASFEDIVAFARSKEAPVIFLKRSDQNLRDFEYEKALSRTDLVEILYRGILDGEEVAILRVKS